MSVTNNTDVLKCASLIFLATTALLLLQSNISSGGVILNGTSVSVEESPLLNEVSDWDNMNISDWLTSESRPLPSNEIVVPANLTQENNSTSTTIPPIPSIAEEIEATTPSGIPDFAEQNDAPVIVTDVEVDDYDYRWKDGIVPWKVYPPFNELLAYDVHNRIKEAMDEIENKTCIRFVKISEGVKIQGPWVRFYEETNYTYPEGLNCMSIPGSAYPGQILMLGRDCMDHSMILHEIMHALGFLHEHQRPDRDDHILINLENVPDFIERQFEKIPDMSTKMREFDFDSVLLYGPFDGSVNGEPVLTRKDGRKMLNRSDKPGLSNGDIDMINKEYDCPK